MFARSCYLADLIKREEVVPDRIMPRKRQYFDKLIDFMISQRLLTITVDDYGEKKIFPKTSGEATLLMIGSIVWPMIDTYYIALITALSMVKKKD